MKKKQLPIILVVLGTLLILFSCSEENGISSSSQFKNKVQNGYFVDNDVIAKSKSFHDEAMCNFIKCDSLKFLLKKKFNSNDTFFSENDFKLIEKKFIKFSSLPSSFEKELEETFEFQKKFVFSKKGDAYQNKTIKKIYNSAEEICLKIKNDKIKEDFIYLIKDIKDTVDMYDKTIKGNSYELANKYYLEKINEMKEHNFNTIEGAYIAAIVIGSGTSSIELNSQRNEYIAFVTGQDVAEIKASSGWRSGFDQFGAAVGAAASIASGYGIVPGPHQGAIIGAGSFGLSYCWDLGDALGRWLFD